MILPVRIPFQERAVVTVERHLPGPGKIMVRVGEEVTPDTVLGEAQISAGFRKVSLAQTLGVSPGSVEKILIKKPGEVVYKGEPLARAKKLLGLRSSVYLSPAEGVVEGVQDGEVTIRLVPSEVKLLAGFNGQVNEIKEGEGVTIKTIASRTKGVFGIGRERFGTIRLAGKRDEFLLPQHLDAECVGKIVVGGALLTGDTIEKALAIGVKGIVTGGINFHETLGWAEGSDVGISIVVTGGYGLHPIDEAIYKALGGHEGQYGSISGGSGEVLISGSGEAKGKPAPLWKELKLGDVVRVVAGADLGHSGPAEKISTEEVKLSSGISAKVVTFKGPGGDEIAPWQNLEIVGLKND